MNVKLYRVHMFIAISVKRNIITATDFDLLLLNGYSTR